MDESLPSLLLQFSGTVEYELLVRLCLKQWEHLHADDVEYCNSLLESATEVLREASIGQQHLASVPPQSMNLVAAMWCVESIAEQDSVLEPVLESDSRREWLAGIKRALPSCFCDPEDLL